MYKAIIKSVQCFKETLSNSPTKAKFRNKEMSSHATLANMTKFTITSCRKTSKIQQLIFRPYNLYSFLQLSNLMISVSSILALKTLFVNIHSLLL